MREIFTSPKIKGAILTEFLLLIWKHSTYWRFFLRSRIKHLPDMATPTIPDRAIIDTLNHEEEAIAVTIYRGVTYEVPPIDTPHLKPFLLCCTCHGATDPDDGDNAHCPSPVHRRRRAKFVRDTITLQYHYPPVSELSAQPCYHLSQKCAQDGHRCCKVFWDAHAKMFIADPVCIIYLSLIPS